MESNKYFVGAAKNVKELVDVTVQCMNMPESILK